MRKHKNKIIAGVVIAIVLAFVFWYGGDAPGLRGWTPEPQENVTVVKNDEPTKEEIKEAEKTISDIPVKEENEPATDENKPQKQDGTPMTPAEKIAIAEKIAESTQSSAEETTSSAEIKQSNEEYSEEQGMVINEVTGKDQRNTNIPVTIEIKMYEKAKLLFENISLNSTFSQRESFK